MRRFRAPVLPGPGLPVTLEEDSSHHLLRVTGVAPGEAVLLFDGAGQEAEAVLVGADAGRARLTQVGAARAVAVPEVHLLIGVSKHAAMDLLLRMATELGVRRIQPVLTSRCVATGERVDRWERITESAAAQCGRAELPEIAPVRRLDQALAAVPLDLERRVLVPGGPRRAPAVPPCALLVGPEGGLSEAEVQQAVASGFSPEGLGARVLRVDTAVAAALARLL